MSECKTCGRDDGHHIGCPEAAKPSASDHDLRNEGHASERPEEGATCAFGDCKNPKRPKGKGPAPKYCEEHSDPKNRK